MGVAASGGEAMEERRGVTDADPTDDDESSTGEAGGRLTGLKSAVETAGTPPLR
jgi:hypothetical protein